MAKNTRQPTSSRSRSATSGTATATESARRSENHEPTEEEIAKRAYEIYQARGGTGGAALDDWLEAERQLKRRSR